MPDPEKEHTNGVSDDALDSPERPGSPGTPSGERDVAEGDRDRAGDAMARHIDNARGAILAAISQDHRA